MTRRQPSVRWSREHGQKKIHRRRWQAVFHAWRINTFHDDGKRKREPYPCHWGQWYWYGEVAPKHWHVGRPTTNHRRGYDGPWMGHSPETQTRNKV